MDNRPDSYTQFGKSYDIYREYYKATVNLFITFCIGLLGFVFSTLKEATINYNFIWWLRLGIISTGISIILGIIISYLRHKSHISNFRYYASKTLNEPKEKGLVHVKEEKRYTWIMANLFRYQLFFMLLGVIFLSIYFAYSMNIW